MKRGPRSERDTGHIEDTNVLLDRLNADNYAVSSGNLATIMEAAADAKADGKGIAAGVVKLGPGDYLLSDTLDAYRGSAGMQIVGSGKSTRLVCDFNDTGKSLVKIANAQDCQLKDVQLIIPAGKAAKAAVQLIHDGNGGGVAPRWNKLQGVHIEPEAGGVLNYGILVGGIDEAYINTTNDFHQFENVQIQSSVIANAALTGDQSYGNRFKDCRFHTAPYGVSAGRAEYAFEGGTVVGHTVANFTKGYWIYNMVRLLNVNSEASARFFLDVGGADVHMLGCRYSDVNMHEDGQPVKMNGSGYTSTYSVEHCKFGDGGSDRDLTFDFSGAGSHTRTKFEMCKLFTTSLVTFTGVNEVKGCEKVIDERNNVRQMMNDIPWQ